jgi:two-component system, OmpR family, sensor histidine kinase BaeS
VNRLWVRFALVIAGVILLITLLPLVYVVAVMQEIIPAPVAFQKMAELEAQLPPELQEQFAVRIETFVGESVVQSLILAAVVGILAGAWLSHLLARPLQALERGAQAVAGQNLAHRVAVRGSREIQTVALAFNQMAAQLEQAEGLRRNLLADVAALVKETAAAFKPLAATKKIQLQVELLGSLSPLSVDAARIRQVVHNLLANALSHTPENGRILVRVIEQGDTLLIQIIDSGPGIATEQLPFVFDRFYRTDMARSREMGGAGLGLAIVKAITEAHGGRVQVERGNQYVSGDQPGSMFTIYLPLA